MLGKKHFVKKVLGYGISSLYAITMSIKELAEMIV
jgi:hypothetical protein